MVTTRKKYDNMHYLKTILKYDGKYKSNERTIHEID